MKNRVYNNLKIDIDVDKVLGLIDCTKDNPAYDDFFEEYKEIFPKAEKLIAPVCIAGMGKIPDNTEIYNEYAGKTAIYSIVSVGREISEYITELFAQDEYIKAMICNAIADEAILALDEQIRNNLREYALEEGFGIDRRLEAPQDISMDIHREVSEELELDKKHEIKLTSGLMFDPVKTSCNIFILTSDKSVIRTEHDCINCPNMECRQRNKAEVTVITDDKQNRVLKVPVGMTLFDAFIKNGIYMSAPCGGKGKCGKCKVVTPYTDTHISDSDRKVFSKEQLAAGLRLACTLRLTENVEIHLDNNQEKNFEIIGAENVQSSKPCNDKKYDIAIDIGTTTIAAVLLGANTHTEVASAVGINSQRQFGADVISRIKASNEGMGKELRECIIKDLKSIFSQLSEKAQISPEAVERIVISGNTTMEHLLLGYSCEKLGVYPFTPVDIELRRTSYKEVFNSNESNAQVIILPGISTYVGADIVSGLYDINMAENKKVTILVDLGTNGEMAIGNEDRILVTSTAAGPAFEGGNITCGTGSIPGAICSAEITDGKMQCRTIGDRKPAGICGTGVIEILAELVKNEIVDETGMLDDDYFEDGYTAAFKEDGTPIIFTQKDVRELQLAKAAVAAGIEILMKNYGIKAEDVSRLYIAGGFGYRLNIEKAVMIGMIPESFRDRIEVIGNSSLAGAAGFLKDNRAEEKMQIIKEKAVEIELAKDKDFMNLYTENMMFEIVPGFL